MPLILTPEDGSIVSGANTYATLVQIRAYNAQRGVLLPADDDALTALATDALDFLEAYEPRWKGDRASPLLQELSWPRQNVWVFGSRFDGSTPAYPSNAIPKQILNAQCYLAGVAVNVKLAPVLDTRAITKEVIGPIETDYDTKTGATVRPSIPQVDAMLAPLINIGTGIVRSVRV